MRGISRKKVFLSSMLFLFLLTAFFRGSVFAQTVMVTLDGKVTDAEGAALPGVTVTAKNAETGYTKSVLTRDNGRYIISGLQPGRYDCEVSLPGFATEIKKGLTFSVGARLTVDFLLKLATVEKEVIVTAESPMVETTKSEVSAVVDRIKIDSLPLLDRDFGSLSLMKAGVNPDYGSSNGQPYGSEDILTDGVSNEELTHNQQNMGIPADAIQEFRVMTNQFEAEFGNSSGMVRSALTRSGTNAWRGRAALFWRDEMFDDVNYFVNHDGYQGKKLSKSEYEKAPYNHLNWSGNLGGPLKKDKIHFFLTYEGIAHREYSTITSPLVPKETIPFDMKSANVLAKLNYQLSEKNLFSLRYSLQSSRYLNLNNGGLWTKSTTENYEGWGHEFQLNWTNYPSDKTMNEVRLLYSYGYGEELSKYPDAENGYFIERPSGYFGPPYWTPQGGGQKRFQFVENFSLFVGNHSLKFGVDAIRTIQEGYIQIFVPGYYLFDTDAPFDPADPSTYPYLLIKGGKRTKYNAPGSQIGIFAQDSWKVTSRLTLNYGLRYNYYTVTYLDINHSNIRNFNPRFGFSWDPIGDGKTVIRGGIGTFSQNIQYNVGYFASQDMGGSAQYIFNPGYPDPSVPNPFNPGSTYDPPTAVTRAEPSMISPYSVQTTLGFQREFMTDLSLSLDFVLTKGYGFVAIDNDNPVLPGTGYLRPDNTKADLFVLRGGGRSDYKALYVTVNKRYSHGWSLDIAYTLSRSWAHLEESGQELATFDEDKWTRMWGPSDVDATHRLAVTSIVDLPLGFQLSGLAYYRSALPWTPYYAEDINLDSRQDMVDSHRNTRRGFDSFEINLRVSKFITINRLSFQLFAEAYNVTNRVNFSYIYNIIDSPDVGKPLAAGSPRRIQFGARFDF
jgi:hypothetical protein